MMALFCENRYSSGGLFRSPHSHSEITAFAVKKQGVSDGASMMPKENRRLYGALVPVRRGLSAGGEE